MDRYKITIADHFFRPPSVKTITIMADRDELDYLLREITNPYLTAKAEIVLNETGTVNLANNQASLLQNEKIAQVRKNDPGMFGRWAKGSSLEEFSE